MTPEEVWKVYGWAISMTLWILIGVVLVWQPTGSAQFWLALLLGYGAFSASGLLGFLFGIPAQSSGGKPTHLEQIADWLTKIILGAGLVELKDIAESTAAYAQKIGPSLGQEYGEVTALLIIVSAASLGLLTGYLWSQYHFK